MHYKQKEWAVNKYAPFLLDPNGTETSYDLTLLREALAADEKNFSAEDIEELVEAIVKFVPEHPSFSTDGQPAAPPKMAWYDEFQVRIQKREVRNPLLGKNETIITGWELGKKLHPKLVEPHLAKNLNAFANGHQVDGIGLYLVPKDTMRAGDILPYRTYAEEQGRNLQEDINILLNPTN